MRMGMFAKIVSNQKMICVVLIFGAIISRSVSVELDSTRELTEDYIRKAGIVPAKEALKILISSRKNDNDVTKHNFREARQNMNPDKIIDEMCAVSSSLTCGKKILKYLSEVSLDDSQNVHDRCKARQEFLECVGLHKKSCQKLARKNQLPDLPSDNVIKDTQSKISKALWTSGGCLLS